MSAGMSLVWTRYELRVEIAIFPLFSNHAKIDRLLLSIALNTRATTKSDSEQLSSSGVAAGDLAKRCKTGSSVFLIPFRCTGNS